MLPVHAAKLLELPADATPEQIEARFLELRRKLEDKIARAPTPGLQAKYRESLTEITTAFETLVLAADSSALPVLSQTPAAGAQPTLNPSAATAPAAATKPKSGGREFIFVALLGLAVLAGGGWFVMQTRAEKAAAAAEAQRQQQLKDARDAAATRQAAELRIALATAKVAWEAMENRLRDAERRLSDAKSELRSFRDGPAWKKAELSAMAHRHELFTQWFDQHLANHPARIARAKAEQFLADKLVDEAAEAVAELQQELATLQAFVPERAARMLTATADAKIESKPAGLAFVFTDAYGRTTEGTTPATLTGLPLSHLHDPKYDGDAGDTEVALGEFSVEPSVRFLRKGWADVVETGRISADDGNAFSAEFPEGSLAVSSQPSGVPFVATNALGWQATGTTPATVGQVPPGSVRVTLSRPGYADVWQNLTVEAGQTARTLPLDHRSQTVQITVAEAKAKIFVDGKFAGQEKATLSTLAPGEHALQLEAPGHPPYRRTFKVKQEATVQTQAYSFQQLAAQNITCATCQGAGKFARQRACDQCNGTRRISHYYCDGRGTVGGRNGFPVVTCPGGCGGSGRVACDHCRDGRFYWDEYCQTCGGDGRVSQLELAR